MDIESIINDLKFNKEEIFDNLKSINGPTILIGSGGSRVVAEFASMVLETKNKIFTKVLDVRDLNYIDLKRYENIFIASFSGANAGVHASIIDNKNTYLLSKRKTKIKNETLLHYEVPEVNSFISLEATIVPMTILLEYYLGDKFSKVFSKIIKSIDKGMNFYFNSSYINIYSGIDSKTTETFLESTLTESGIAAPLIHTKYDYCHGRSTINKHHSSSSIYLCDNGTYLDKKLKEVLDVTMTSTLTIKKKFKDEIVNDYYMCLQCMYLLINIGLSKNIDLRNIKYDRDAVKKLYYFKGSM